MISMTIQYKHVKYSTVMIPNHNVFSNWVFKIFILDYKSCRNDLKFAIVIVYEKNYAITYEDRKSPLFNYISPK